MVAERLGTPLAQPVWTSYILAVAVLGENGLLNIWSGQIVAENFIYDAGNTIKNVTIRNPLVVVSR